MASFWRNNIVLLTSRVHQVVSNTKTHIHWNVSSFPCKSTLYHYGIETKHTNRYTMTHILTWFERALRWQDTEHTLKRKCLFDEFSSLAVLEFIILTTAGAANNENFVKNTALSFQCSFNKNTLDTCNDTHGRNTLTCSKVKLANWICLFSADLVSFFLFLLP